MSAAMVTSSVTTNVSKMQDDSDTAFARHSFRRRCVRHIGVYLVLRCVLFFGYLYWTSSMTEKANATLPSTRGLQGSASLSLPFVLRRDSYTLIKEALFLRKASASSTNFKMFTHQNYSTPLLPFQTVYAAHQNAVLPLVVSCLEGLQRVVCLPGEVLFFLLVLFSDGLAAYFLARTVEGLRFAMSNRRSDLATLVDIVDTQNADPSVPRICPSDGDDAKASAVLYHVQCLTADEMVSSESIIAFYLINPIMIGIQFFPSSYSFRATCLVAAISFSLVPASSRGSSIFGPSALGLLIYFTPAPAALAFAPALAHAYHQATLWKKRRQKEQLSALGYHLFEPFSRVEPTVASTLLHSMAFFGVTLLTLCCLHLASYYLCGGSWMYLRSTVLSVLRSDDLTPNLGVFWYMTQLILARYRSLFVVFYQSVGLLVVFPFLIRCFRLPVTVVQLITATFLLFQPYPSAPDFVLFVWVILLDFPILQRTWVFPYWIWAVLGVGCLYITKMAVWLQRSTESPNIVFILQLIIFLMTCGLLSDYIQRAVRYRLSEHRLKEKNCQVEH